MHLRLHIWALPVLFAITCGCANDRGGRDPSKPYSIRMADTIIARHPNPTAIERDPKEPWAKWSYSTSFAVQAIAEVGVRTGDRKYIDYGRRYMEAFVNRRGAIGAEWYKPKSFKLDDVAPGRLLLLLYEQTGDTRWLEATRPLARQLQAQPRTSDRGFWHKKIYPHQMWLDGIYMDCPFMVEYAKVTGETVWFDEAAVQITTIAKHTHDSQTGLYYHGWDERRKERWANKQTGTSPCIWGRAVGWYVMGMVETLEDMPADHPRRGEIVELLRDLSEAIAKVQDPKTGLWYQVLDQPAREGNYPESSASGMIVYALAKGARLKLIDPKFAAIASRGYEGILKQFVEVDPKDGRLNLKDTCQVAGLGGKKKYRDGSFAYYMSEPRVSNDPKGLAPFILASLEIESLASSQMAMR
jgi:unsaturated rhamnogalacturonyl hydrolase